MTAMNSEVWTALHRRSARGSRIAIRGRDRTSRHPHAPRRLAGLTRAQLQRMRAEVGVWACRTYSPASDRRQSALTPVEPGFGHGPCNRCQWLSASRHRKDHEFRRNGPYGSFGSTPSLEPMASRIRSRLRDRSDGGSPPRAGSILTRRRHARLPDCRGRRRGTGQRAAKHRRWSAERSGCASLDRPLG
jgi:hypothetical protein